MHITDTSQNKKPCRDNPSGPTVVLGGGLAGLSAGYFLGKSGKKAVVLEADNDVGGLSKTLNRGDFFYDIGGHRFHTHNDEVERTVRDLMGDELTTVCRTSKIFMMGRFFDYPLRPRNAVFGLGMPMVMKILADYVWQRIRNFAGGKREDVSLEDWVVRRFGRTMFNIYFKEYSEKVWGIDCNRISRGWVARRIQGLSLGKAVKNAIFKFTGREIPTLADSFLYPRMGIGRISERFREEIEKQNDVFTNSSISRLSHDGSTVTGVRVSNGAGSNVMKGANYISTIPLNSLVLLMDPPPPSEVAEAALGLGFRDLVIVAVMVDRETVTDQSWIYIPEKKFPFGRMHEPKIWSPGMAPPGKTLVVVEYFCFQNDNIWNKPDPELSETTVEGLRELGFIREGEVLDTVVTRIPKAYPLFEVGFEKHCETIYRYLDGFSNLHIAGRSGMFQYQNMDHAIASGAEAAREVLANGGPH